MYKVLDRKYRERIKSFSKNSRNDVLCHDKVRAKVYVNKENYFTVMKMIIYQVNYRFYCCKINFYFPRLKYILICICGPFNFNLLESRTLEYRVLKAH